MILRLLAARAPLDTGTARNGITGPSPQIRCREAETDRRFPRMTYGALGRKASIEQRIDKLIRDFPHYPNDLR